MYNTFVWLPHVDEQRDKLKQQHKGRLDAIANHYDNALAYLYDNTAMLLDLRKPHRANISTVCDAYGCSKDIGEEEIVVGIP